MIFTQEQRQKITELVARILTDLWHMKWQDKITFISQGLAQKKADELISAVEKMEPIRSFSASISTDEKTCPTCGSLWVVSRRYLPRYLIPALRLLSQRDLSTVDAMRMTGNRQVYTKFAWLVHWGLTEKIDGKMYRITPKGRSALKKEIKIEEFLWMLKNEVVGTPEGEESPALVYVDELRSTDTADHAEHVERSAPVAA